jgi:hypothetical protein
MATRIVMIAAAALAVAGWPGVAEDSADLTSAPAASDDAAPSPAPSPSSKRVLGSMVTVSEVESGLEFVARVDTGATICSLHAEDLSVRDGSPVMQENVGKRIQFRTVNRRGESIWLERPIAGVSEIRTSEQAEWRYLVPMTLVCAGIERQVLVSLNDRSQMSYAMLLGRNLLAGEFVVDVGGEI